MRSVQNRVDKGGLSSAAAPTLADCSTTEEQNRNSTPFVHMKQINVLKPNYRVRKDPEISLTETEAEEEEEEE